jgi:hypothetical protein
VESKEPAIFSLLLILGAKGMKIILVPGLQTTGLTVESFRQKE